MGGDSGPHKPVNEPTTDSQLGEDESRGGALLAPPRHRSGLDDRGLPADPQGWCSGHRRCHSGRLRSEPGGQSVDLLERIKSSRYRAPPVRRAYIPKADGSQRMLGIPTFEDKVAQRAVTMVLEEIYEQDFLSCSYRLPARTVGSPGAPHFAERTLGQASLLGARYRHTKVPSNSIPHSHLRAFLDRRGHGRRHPKDDR